MRPTDRPDATSTVKAHSSASSFHSFVEERYQRAINSSRSLSSSQREREKVQTLWDCRRKHSKKKGHSAWNAVAEDAAEDASKSAHKLKEKF